MQVTFAATNACDLPPVAVALLSGALPTNQGGIRRSHEPAVYWRWLRRLSGLLLLCVAVLLGSYWLGV